MEIVGFEPMTSNAIQALSQLSYTPTDECYYSTGIPERKDQK